MAANAWVIYNNAKLKIHNSTMVLPSDTLKVSIMSSGYTPAATHALWSSISANEIANGNGYGTGGVTVTGSVTESGGTVTFDISDPQWTASGGPIVGRYAVLRNDTTGENIAYSLMDNTPADVTCTDTNTLTLIIPSTGVYQSA